MFPIPTNEKWADYAILAVSLVLGILIYKLLSRWLERLESSESKRLHESKRFDPVRASSVPVADHTESFRRRALENVGSQFSIIRKTLLIVLLLIWIATAVGLTVSDLPGGLISFFGAGGAVLIGIAARPFLENVIAGYVVTFSDQFHTGDTVMIDGEYGTILDITPTHTIISLWDWRRYVVPNAAMLSKEVFNYANRENLLWSRLKFHVDYGADLEFVKETAIRLAKESRFFVGEDDPQFWVMALGKESVECWLATWVRGPADAWGIRVEVGEKLVREFAEAGVRTHSYQLSPAPEGPMRESAGEGEGG